MVGSVESVVVKVETMWETGGSGKAALDPGFPVSLFGSILSCSPLSLFFTSSSISAISSSSAASSVDARMLRSHCTNSSFLLNSFLFLSVSASNSSLSFSNRCFSMMASFFIRSASAFLRRRIDDVVDETCDTESWWETSPW